MLLKQFIFILFCTINSLSFCMEKSPPVVVVCISEHKQKIEREESDDSVPDKKCCNSSTKLKLALVGLASTGVTALVALIIHFTKC